MGPTAGSNRWTGFTLIELLVTIAVLVVLATLAVPGFQGLMVSNRLAADHNEIIAGLNFARSEAVKRREEIAAVLTPDGSGIGWNLEVWHDDGSGSITCPGDAKCLQVRDASGSPVKLDSGSSTVTFNALGRLSSSANVQVDLSHGGSSESICIGLAGRVGDGCG